MKLIIDEFSRPGCGIRESPGVPWFLTAEIKRVPRTGIRRVPRFLTADYFSAIENRHTRTARFSTADYFSAIENRRTHAIAAPGGLYTNSSGIR